MDAKGTAGIAGAVASLTGFVDQLAGALNLPSDPWDGVGRSDGYDPLHELSESCLNGLGIVARVEAATAAVKVRLLAEYSEAAAAMEAPAENTHESSARDMSVVAEVACTLTVGEGAASALLQDAHALTTSLPATLNAMEAGAVSWRHAQIMVDEANGLDSAATAALEAHFLDPEAPNAARGASAGELVPGRFRRKLRAWRERHHPESLESRHVKSWADRRMEYSPDREGMAWVSLYLAADSACAVWNKTSALARGLQGPDEPRTLTQLRADVAAKLLLGGTADLAGPGPSLKSDVLVTVPILSLLGVTDEPADLDNYGPIPASMARRLVTEGAGSFYRVLVDPRDGAPLELGRTNYRLTEALKRWLRMRDGKCTFPGCSSPSPDNEADHLRAWERGGTTGIGNLGQLCPKHHRLKHRTGWSPGAASRNEPPAWTSPSGRKYKAEQPDREPTHWPPGCLPGETSVLEASAVDYLAAL